MEKYNFKKMNEFTYYHSQWPNEERSALLDVIMETSGYDRNISIKLCASDCYKITALQNVIFNKKSNYSLKDLSQFVYDNKYFVYSKNQQDKPGSYQIVSTKQIYASMKKENIISNYSYTDCDYGIWKNGVKVYTDEARQKCFDELMIRMTEKNFNSARVCFDNGSTHGHAIMVCNDDEGKPVVIDNSSRPHECSGNDLYKHITSQNIKWWTEIS